MNYLPFNLETALKHPERVVTRDGRRVSEIHHLKVKATYQPIHCVAEGEPLTCWETGGYCGDKRLTHNLDLFLLPEVKECWVNVYYSECGGVEIGSPRQTKSDCLSQPGCTSSGYIKTIRITNESE